MVYAFSYSLTKDEMNHLRKFFIVLLALTFINLTEASASLKMGTITIKEGASRIVEAASSSAYTASGSWSKEGTNFSITGTSNYQCTIRGLRAGSGVLRYKGYVTGSGWSASQYWDLYWDVIVEGDDPDPDPIKVTSVTVNPSTATLKLDGTKTVQLTATVLPSNATNRSVSWTTSNSSVATVSGGLVTAVAAGDVTITCTATDGSGKYGTCAVKVNAAEPIPVESVTLNQSSIALNLIDNKTKQLSVTVLPSNATDKSVTWSSSDNSVATVSSSGMVTAQNRGSAVITCKANDGSGKQATCSVTVAGVKNNSYFTAKTIEGVEMTFYVNQVSSGECSVDYKYPDATIDKNTSGPITIPSEVEGLKVTAIHSYAFKDCINITQVTIPSSVESIGSSTFSDCTSLTTVALGNGVKKLDSYVFFGCSSLSTITGIQSLEYIGSNAFDDSYSDYIPWYNNLPDGLLYLGKVLYKYKGTMPDNTSIDIKEGTTMIGSHAFYYCNGLVSVTIPQSVKDISYSAFVACPNLGSIIVASGNETFDSRNNCNAIVKTATNTIIAGCKTTTFPNTVTAIGMYAFSGSVPEEVVIPNNIDSIAYEAFYFCDDLKSVIIGKGTRKIETKNWNGHAFFYCKNLRSIAVASGNPYLDSRDNCNAIIDKATDRLIAGCPTTIIPSSVKSIGSEAFENYNGIYSVTIPDRVETIEYRAFDGLSDLHTLVLGKNLKTIGTEAFSGCRQLKIIQSLANEPAEMDESVFAYNSSQPDIVYDNATLYVPVGSKINYMTSNGWSKFKNIKEGVPPVLVTAINLDKSALSLTERETEQLSAIVSPDDATDKSVTWKSSNDDVATVSTSGLVTAVAAGKATITCTANDESGASAKCEVTVTSASSPGDINGDGQVNGTDYVTLANIILGKSERKPAADVNGDGSVNGTDYVVLVNIILGKGASKVKAAAASTTQLAINEEFDIKAGETKEMLIELNNPNDEITLVQFDLRLPDGLSIATEDGEYAIDIAGRTTWKKHSLDANATDGIVRFLLSSTKNTVLEGNSGAIITMKLAADNSYKNGAIRLENILLVTPDEKEIKPADVVIDTADTVNGIVVDAASDDAVYTLSGLRLTSPQKGVNIVGGKKIVVK